ncbi:MAG: amidohydrolase family protein [Vicinamibacteria bacterium]|jgi:imidazolonepropionase-like amidohydrolase|nr:amidohydrolase family protein [Vicinamibacteria bacterium]
MNRNALLALALFAAAVPAGAQLAVRGETVYTMAGAPLKDGVVLVGKDGKIEKVGAGLAIPAGYKTLSAKVVTPGLVDARSTVGFTGWLNQSHDQEQLERSAPLQPELRAIDGYNPQDRLVEWVRGFGITTVHTGHGPGAVISGQTLVAKTRGHSVERDVIVPSAMIAATLGQGGRAADGKSPGTKPKMIALLRAELIKAQEYLKKKETAEKGKEPEPNLRLEALLPVLKGERPLLVTVHRASDILTTLRVADEFKIKVVLDGAAEVQAVLEQVKKAGVPVIVHPTMARHGGELENASFETASVLRKAGIPVAMQTGFEGYVPKVRVLLFEAAIAAAHGLGLEGALAAATIDAAKLVGVDKRVGSLEPGKDGDLALFDGDPFEYTTRVTGVVIEGEVVSSEAR